MHDDRQGGTDEMTDKAKLSILLIGVVFLGSVASAFARKDSESGRIRILYVGDFLRPSPYPLLEAEPLIALHPAWPVGETLTMPTGTVKKAFRQYIPRTYDLLAENDAIIIDNPDASIFEDKHLIWFRDAVTEAGSGLVMVGGNGAFGGRPNTPWGPTVVQEVLPVWCVTGGWLEFGRVQILKPEHDLLSSLPLDRRWEWMEYAGGNQVRMKDGAELLAQYKSLTGDWTNPFWASWDVGQGRCFAMTMDWSPMGGVIFMRWPYYGDFAVNLMLYLSKNPIPADLETLHYLRRLYQDFSSSRAYLFNVMDFAEKLGANMAPVGRIIGEAESKRGESVEQYIEQEFEAAAERLESSLEDMARASGKALDLKNQAMFWIYVIEWCAVTATFAVGGFVIWTLMVRRGLYREVERTRFER